MKVLVKIAIEPSDPQNIPTESMSENDAVVTLIDS